MKHHNYFTYITTNQGRSVFYTGVTNDVEGRLKQHYDNKGNPETFAGRYYCYNLVYLEPTSDINFAIEREKEIKALSRDEKIELIKSVNPYLRFLTRDTWEF